MYFSRIRQATVKSENVMAMPFYKICFYVTLRMQTFKDLKLLDAYHFQNQTIQIVQFNYWIFALTELAATLNNNLKFPQSAQDKNPTKLIQISDWCRSRVFPYFQIQWLIDSHSRFTSKMLIMRGERRIKHILIVQLAVLISIFSFWNLCEIFLNSDWNSIFYWYFYVPSAFL